MLYEKINVVQLQEFLITSSSLKKTIQSSEIKLQNAWLYDVLNIVVNLADIKNKSTLSYRAGGLNNLYCFYSYKSFASKLWKLSVKSYLYSKLFEENL